MTGKKTPQHHVDAISDRHNVAVRAKASLWITIAFLVLVFTAWGCGGLGDSQTPIPPLPPADDQPPSDPEWPPTDNDNDNGSSSYLDQELTVLMEIDTDPGNDTLYTLTSNETSEMLQLVGNKDAGGEMTLVTGFSYWPPDGDRSAAGFAVEINTDGWPTRIVSPDGSEDITLSYQGDEVTIEGYDSTGTLISQTVALEAGLYQQQADEWVAAIAAKDQVNQSAIPAMGTRKTRTAALEAGLHQQKADEWAVAIASRDDGDQTSVPSWLAEPDWLTLPKQTIDVHGTLTITQENYTITNQHGDALTGPSGPWLSGTTGNVIITPVGKNFYHAGQGVYEFDVTHQIPNLSGPIRTCEDAYGTAGNICDVAALALLAIASVTPQTWPVVAGISKVSGAVLTLIDGGLTGAWYLCEKHFFQLAYNEGMGVQQTDITAQPGPNAAVSLTLRYDLYDFGWLGYGGSDTTVKSPSFTAEMQVPGCDFLAASLGQMNPDSDDLGMLCMAARISLKQIEEGCVDGDAASAQATVNQVCGEEEEPDEGELTVSDASSAMQLIDMVPGAWIDGDSCKDDLQLLNASDQSVCIFLETIGACELLVAGAGYTLDGWSWYVLFDSGDWTRLYISDDCDYTAYAAAYGDMNFCFELASQFEMLPNGVQMDFRPEEVGLTRVPINHGCR